MKIRATPLNVCLVCASALATVLSLFAKGVDGVGLMCAAILSLLWAAVEIDRP